MGWVGEFRYFPQERGGIFSFVKNGVGELIHPFKYIQLLIRGDIQRIPPPNLLAETKTHPKKVLGVYGGRGDQN